MNEFYNEINIHGKKKKRKEKKKKRKFYARGVKLGSFEKIFKVIQTYEELIFRQKKA